MPGDPGVTVVTILVCFYHFAHKAAGAASARHSPCPLLAEGGMFLHNSGALCVAIGQVRAATSLRGAKATKQSTLPCCSMDCFACARNDEVTFRPRLFENRIRTRGRALAGLLSQAAKSVFTLASLGYAGHASPFRSCVAAPRVARKGEAWCPWPESNQHSLRNSILSRARLPIPPQGLSDRAIDGVAKPAEYSGRRVPV